MQKTQPLYYWECLFTAPLHSNGSYSNVACVFVAAEMCLPSRYLALNVYLTSLFRLSGVMSEYIVDFLNGSFLAVTTGQLSRYSEGPRVWRRGSIPGRGKRFFFSTQRPERLWGPHPDSHSMGTRGAFSERQSGLGVKLITHLTLVPRSRMVELYLHFPIRLHGVVLNYAQG
jgi:hypothetical protein